MKEDKRPEDSTNSLMKSVFSSEEFALNNIQAKGSSQPTSLSQDKYCTPPRSGIKIE